MEPSLQPVGLFSLGPCANNSHTCYEAFIFLQDAFTLLWGADMGHLGHFTGNTVRKNSSISFMPTGGKQRLRWWLSGVLNIKAPHPESQKSGVWGSVLWICLQGNADVAASVRQCKTLGSCGPEDTTHWLGREDSKGRAELKRMFPAECTPPGWAEVSPCGLR